MLRFYQSLNNKGAEWIQIDEPILVKNQNADFTKLIKKTLNQLKEICRFI